MNNSKLIKRFLPYYRPYTKILVCDLFCAAISSACDLALPVIAKQITERATTDITTLTLKFILSCGVFYMILRIIGIAANYYQTKRGHVMGASIETDMRRDMFTHLQKLSFSYYDDTKIGTIMSRMTSDLFEVTEFSHHCPEEFLNAGVIILVSFVILCTMNIPLTLIVFAMLPLMGLGVGYFRKRMKDAQRFQRKKVGELNSQVEDSLSGIRVVRSFANEEAEEEKFKTLNEEFLDTKITWYGYMAGFTGVTRFFDGLMYITVLVVGGIFVMQGKITAAELVAYLLYVTTLLNAIKRIVEFIEQFQKGMTGIERFAEIMDTEPEITDKKDATELKNVRGEITFKNVSFAYSDGKPVLERLNLTVPAGKSYALIGPSGAGKTTVCNLIPRFYEATDGEILIDGVNIRDVTLSSLRQNIGIVQQDVYLFSGTVKENILYGRADATDEDVRNAARLAGADDFISELERGYDTYVGERGVKLSGGQKQRISIARVFLKNPPVLILDEATSALDNESERLVQESLERLAKGRTTVTIAHRLTTIKNADRVLLLNDKGIEKAGTFEEVVGEI